MGIIKRILNDLYCIFIRYNSKHKVCTTDIEDIYIKRSDVDNAVTILYDVIIENKNGEYAYTHFGIDIYTTKEFIMDRINNAPYTEVRSCLSYLIWSEHEND
jgi:hypothetical protein